jgi:hypothetical protein
VFGSEGTFIVGGLEGQRESSIVRAGAVVEAAFALATEHVPVGATDHSKVTVPPSGFNTRTLMLIGLPSFPL